ncbi:MAG: prenyltransferase [Thaumarchaeota archaeon]|nr:prenyltransferase [Nitrososphaerota archaeon]MCL5319011.1 prenyltransferase [Nitrososphaerota archaeon]
MLSLRVWARAVRLKFLTASIVAVTNGIVIAFSQQHTVDIWFAAYTFVGVISLHASVDLLNDFFDYKSKIDLMTSRTPFSGGTGVLPEGLLQPKSVYRAGVTFLIIGVLMGLYLMLVRSWLIGPLVMFAGLSTYFYSTKITKAGLGEVFLIVKGTAIVLGSYYVQTTSMAISPLYVGVVLGILSASVLYVNAFPDLEADRSGGRKSLTVRLGAEKASRFYPCFPIAVFTLIPVGVLLGLLPILALASVVALPSFGQVSLLLKKTDFKKISEITPTLAKNALAARTVGVVLALSFIIRGLGLA